SSSSVSTILPVGDLYHNPFGVSFFSSVVVVIPFVFLLNQDIGMDFRLTVCFVQVNLQSIYIIKVLKGFFKAFNKSIFAFSKPNTRVVVFFIGYVAAFGVSYLAFQISCFVFHIITNTAHKGVLHVGVYIHFYHAVAYGFPDFFYGTAGTSVKYKVYMVVTNVVFL